MRALLDFESEYPKIAEKYFDLRFDEHYLSNEEEDQWNI